ncbi:hypothetical protein HPB49_006275 [Dermacentor silvarum]|uniref:Uncharacterized protein n=1 Tax=Dermacentor silvarum TaxID=543639 RepID=A0ACB8C7S6_DERSI|nr:hypothetical protein HPB49_006275 [Dermacentor silvarum]
MASVERLRKNRGGVRASKHPEQMHAELVNLVTQKHANQKHAELVNLDKQIFDATDDDAYEEELEAAAEYDRTVSYSVSRARFFLRELAKQTTATNTSSPEVTLANADAGTDRTSVENEVSDTSLRLSTATMAPRSGDRSASSHSERFGRRDLLINEHVDHLLALSPVKSSAEVEKLRRLYDKVQFRVSALTGLGVSLDQYNVVVNRVLMKCLPDSLAILYRHNSKEATQDPSGPKYFIPDDFEKPRVDGKNKLKWKAIPSIFAHRPQKNPKTPPFPRLQYSLQASTVSQPDCRQLTTDILGDAVEVPQPTGSQGAPEVLEDTPGTQGAPDILGGTDCSAVIGNPAMECTTAGTVAHYKEQGAKEHLRTQRKLKVSWRYERPQKGRGARTENGISPLSRVAGAHRVRVNFRLNIVPVDAATDAPLGPLLAVTEICGVPVRATTAPAESCTGYVFGVDRNLSDDILLVNIESGVAVLGCFRAGRNIVLRFAGRKLPAEVAQFKVRRSVLRKRPRPRQCHHCGAYGHVAATCTSEQRCLRRGGAHKTSGCTAKQATCLNCGGPHAVTEPHCPRSLRKVAENLASSELPISRRQATVLVRTTGQRTTQGPQQLTASRVPSRVQPGRSYADAAGDRPARPPVEGNTSTPAPR